MPPLAHLLRPKTINEFIGQQHLLGEGKPLRQAFLRRHIFSMIFWGPPGVGKTTLAKLLAQTQQRQYFELSAVSASKQDIRQIIESVKENEPAPLLFLDEIHRFTKSQQDFLLPYVERGQLILIGATTENPSFEVIPALLSRTRVFILYALSPDELQQIIDRALNYIAQETKEPKPEMSSKTRQWLLAVANGDARQLLTIIDQTWELYHQFDQESVESAAQQVFLRYDQTGEEHYNTISAYIKSLRASQVDAALYYLARMVEAGEDPQFIARRMVVFASEDIGLAQPTALVVANAVFEAVSKIGYPEARINLAHGTIYLARAPKNRSAYDAYAAAVTDVRALGNLPIPLEVRNAVTPLMKASGYGSGYEMYPEKQIDFRPPEVEQHHYFIEKTK